MVRREFWRLDVLNFLQRARVVDRSSLDFDDEGHCKRRTKGGILLKYLNVWMIPGKQIREMGGNLKMFHFPSEKDR